MIEKIYYILPMRQRNVDGKVFTIEKRECKITTDIYWKVIASNQTLLLLLFPRILVVILLLHFKVYLLL